MIPILLVGAAALWLFSDDKEEGKGLNGSILSKNHNGIVVKKGGKGFSPKVIAKQLEKLCEKLGIDFEISNIAKTGTYYIEIHKENTDLFYTVIRIANHSKRSDGGFEYTKTIEYIKTKYGDVIVSEMNIMDTSQKEEVFEFLKENYSD